MSPNYELKWSPIADISLAKASQLGGDHLTSLARAWRERREQMAKDGLLGEFETRLRREVAIETGLIERLYQFDRGVTITLVEQGIHSALIPHDAGQKPEVIVAMVRDAEAALESLFAIASGKRPLTTSVIHELHAAVTRSQPTTLKLIQLGDQQWFEDRPFLKGCYKETPNSVLLADGRLHEYCPVLHVPTEMEQLLRWHAEHEQQGLAPVVSAAWLHHRFTQIHPYEDGNGRVARLLASVVLIKADWFPLVMTSDRNESYRAALLAADLGDLAPLVSVFTTAIEAGFLRALGIAPAVTSALPVEQVIESVKRRLQARKANLRVQWNRAKTMADVLATRATAALADLGHRLATIDASIRVGANDDTQYRAKNDDEAAANFNHWQIGQGAKRLGYFANPQLFHRWALLQLKASTRCEVMVSLHGVGREFTGQLVASMLFYRREEDQGSSRAVGVVPTTFSHLLISYEDDEAELGKRFKSWFDEGLATALAAWQSTL